MIHQGKYSTSQTPTQAPITYHPGANSWKCNIYGREEKEQEKQNLTIHAHKHQKHQLLKIISKIPALNATQKNKPTKDKNTQLATTRNKNITHKP